MAKRWPDFQRDKRKGDSGFAACQEGPGGQITTVASSGHPSI